MKLNLKSLWPHAVAIVAFMLVSLAYFSPVASGYKLKQHDNITFKGMSAEIQDYRDKYGSEPLWTSHPFGGMPGALISQKFPNNWMPHIDRALQLWLPHPVSLLFICMLGFYIMMLCIRVNPWVGMLGAVAYGLSTYTILCVGAGHNTKVLAIAYMPPVLGTLFMAYRYRPVLGSVLFMLFLALEIRASHLQVTYYMAMILLFYVLAEFARFVIRKDFVSFFSRSFLVLIAAGIAVLPNYSALRTTIEVGKETTRSESKLTVNPDGTPNKKDKTTGLDRSYITDWSYGVKESWNLLVPNAAGGNSRYIGDEAEGRLSDDTNPQIAQQIAQSNAYWGPQEKGTGGPTYLGAVVILLFILGLVFIPDVAKWGILGITLLALMLSWGKNYMGLTDFFIDNVPGYDKFRAVTIILCILQLTVPFIGFWFVDYISKNREKILPKLKIVYITGGAISFILLLFCIMPGSFFDFISPGEKTMFSQNMTGSDTNMVMAYSMWKKGLVEVRSSLLVSDAVRSLILVLLALGVVVGYLKYYASKPFLYVGLGLLLLIDLWGVDYRYLNADPDPTGRMDYKSWVPAEEQANPYYAAEADKFILQSELSKKPGLQQTIRENIDKVSQGIDGEPLNAQVAEKVTFRELGFSTNYRVLTLQDPFNDGRTPYFHKSVGGYHGAKPKRIQEIIEFHYHPEYTMLRNQLSKSVTYAQIDSVLRNMHVLNMVNTRYIIVDETKPALVNPYAMGNAWMVGRVYKAKNADDEILSLSKVDLHKTAVVDMQTAEQLKKLDETDSTGGTIEMTSFKPNFLTYQAESRGNYLAVFSEMYASGWSAYVDGKEAPVLRVNYILRGIMLPAGSHKIEWKYAAPYYSKGESVSLIGSVLVILVLLTVGFLEFTGRLAKDKITVKE